MYSRTKTFFEQFLTAFDNADVAIISDIFPGREHDTGLVHAQDLVEAMVKRGRDQSGGAINRASTLDRQVMYGGDGQSTAKLLGSRLASRGLGTIMGTGEVYL